MNNTRALTINKTSVIVFLALLTVATFAPYARNQYITGTIVNGTLFLTVATLGIPAGLLIGIIPSTIALATGLLPAVMAPMIPFIILGNAALIIGFYYLKSISYWLGAVSGGLLKFGLLTGAISIVTHLISSKNVTANIAYMMGWPQLVTALAGSLVAFTVLSLKNTWTARYR